MAQQSGFFQTKLEASVKQEDRRHTLVFQRAKIPLRHVEELGVLQSINDGISRQVETTEDEIIITAQADPELQPFFKLNNEPYIEKLIFAGNLVHFFETDTYSRIIPICFPENLYFSAGLEPVFLHYGVKDSLPPIEYQAEEVLKDVKAVLAVLFDPAHSFDTYVKFDFATKTIPLVKKFFQCKDFKALAACLAVEKAKEIAEEKQSVRVSKKKNLVKNGLLVASVAVIIPLIFLTVFAYVIKLPRENVFQTSHELFLENQYSDVATALKPVAINDMPKVVRYELAYSYVKNESLTDGERSNALKRLTLQSNPLYFKYWIQNGRGDESGALDTARSLNDLDLTIFALIKEKQAVIENLSMDGKEKEKKLQDIESVLSQYESKLKKNQAAGTNSGAANAQNTQAASSQKDKKASKDQKKANDKATEKKDSGQ